MRKLLALVNANLPGPQHIYSNLSYRRTHKNFKAYLLCLDQNQLEKCRLICRYSKNSIYMVL